MGPKDHKKFIKKSYEEYKKLGHVECPAFGGEKIYFNKYGFNHLIRKGEDLRPIDEQVRRIKLIPNASIILSKVDKIQKCTCNVVDGYPAFFWPFNGTIDSINIRVIVRQLGNNGRKHFYSIMNEDE
jgi:hypothetical protein